MSRTRKGRPVAVSEGRMHAIIRAPLITEKSTRVSEHNQVVFRVADDATKPEIRAAVEKLFSVKVTAVNTLRQKGKAVRFRGRKGRRAGGKKAVVSLAEGHSIDVTSGI